MLRIAICDDDQSFAGELETAIRKECQALRVNIDTEVFYDGDRLINDVGKGVSFDLIFLDIEMEGINGIETAHRIRRLDRSVLLIYVSGHDQYWKELFEAEPFRFLSKPLEKERFCRYFQEAYRRIGENTEFYQFSFNKEIGKVALKDVVYFESRSRVIFIFLENGSVKQLYGKLNDVEKKLAKGRAQFLRIHQSFLVNYDYIVKMNFTSIKVSFVEQEVELKISEDRQRGVRQRLCEIAEGGDSAQ